MKFQLQNEAFKKVLKDYWLTNPTDQNWKTKFKEVFTMSVDEFYLSLKGYTNDINTVLPSEGLKLENVF